MPKDLVIVDPSVPEGYAAVARRLAAATGCTVERIAFQQAVASTGEMAGMILPANQYHLLDGSPRPVLLVGSSEDVPAMACSDEHLIDLGHPDASGAEIDCRVSALFGRIRLLKRLNRAETINRKLFSLANHDLRAPFTSMLGVLNLISQEDLPDEERTGFIQALIATADSQLRLLDSISLWGRGETGRLPVSPRIVELDVVVLDAVQAACHARGAALSRVRVDIADSLRAHADPQLLVHVLGALVDNALRLAPSARPVRVSAGRLPDGLVELRVQDDGPGFPSGFGSPDDPVHAGTGLVCASTIARLLGGSVRIVEPGPGGTTVTLTCPSG